MASNAELACVYAALILQDDEIAITAEKISTILKAANVEAEPYWPTLFAKAFEGVDLRQLITSVGSGTGGAGGAVGGTTDGGEAVAEEPKKEEKKEESDESDGDDMGFGLFD